MSYKGITPTVEIIYAPEMESRKLAALTMNETWISDTRK